MISVGPDRFVREMHYLNHLAPTHEETVIELPVPFSGDSIMVDTAKGAYGLTFAQIAISGVMDEYLKPGDRTISFARTDGLPVQVTVQRGIRQISMQPLFAKPLETVQIQRASLDGAVGWSIDTEVDLAAGATSSDLSRFFSAIGMFGYNRQQKMLGRS